jgi:hypothetical protein
MGLAHRGIVPLTALGKEISCKAVNGGYKSSNSVLAAIQGKLEKMQKFRNGDIKRTFYQGVL